MWKSPGQVQQVRPRGLELILKVLNGRTLPLLIDETGDCKKGTSTDYVKCQYSGNGGKSANGIVAVTAYGLVDGMIVPLTFQVYKPKERLQANEAYYSKPQIAARMMRQLQAMGCVLALVLADSLDGESQVNFVDVLDELKLPYSLAIRSNHAMLLPPDQAVSQEPWQTFERTFSNGTAEMRSIAEVIYGQPRRKQYWFLTTAPQTWPANSTAFVMVSAPAVKLQAIGERYGVRTWLEDGLKPAKDALGWADFRMTRYAPIEQWWELVLSAFLMVSLLADQFNDSGPLTHQQFVQHPWWDNQTGWKH